LLRPQRSGIDAVPDLGRRAAVVEQVAQVLPALAAQQLDALASVGVQGLVHDVILYLLPKAGEARPYIELPAGLEQRMTTVRAGIGTPLLCACCRVYFLISEQDTPVLSVASRVSVSLSAGIDTSYTCA